VPWPEPQRRAIFLNIKRKKGTAAAKRVIHEAGYGGKGQLAKSLSRMKGKP
jgi:hypothetical protein